MKIKNRFPLFLSHFYLFLLLFGGVLFTPKETFADHNAGGELTWECKSNGKFKFTLRLYRFCEGILLGNSAFVQSTSPVTSLTLTRVLTRDISPKCYDSTKWMNCYNSSNSAFTLEESIYESADIQITGVPTSAGWEFYWSSCCRPAPLIYNWGAIVDNLEPQNQSYRIKATMYPYNNKNTYPCYDNSPTFAALPATIICTGYPFTYNHNAVDKDRDSLTYTWTTPLLSSGTSVSYATNLNTNQVTPRASGGNFIVPSPGFSANLPLPWAHSNMNTANVAASMNLFTGEITFKSYTKGQYATAVLVTAYRCNVKIAEIMRDIPVILLACPPTPTVPPLSNTPPQVTFKWFSASPTSIPLPAGDTVWAGDSVTFYITSTDIQFLPGFIGQTNYLIPGGSQFGNGFTDTANGCQYPPCATMDTTSVYFNQSKMWWEGQYGIAAKFGWRTSCNHITQVEACFIRSNKYNFVFRVLDNWCPAPGANFQTFTVTVLAPPGIDPPKLKCSKVLPSGQVWLSWDQPVTKAEDTLRAFRKYLIYRANSPTGPFDTLHIVKDIDSLSYLDVTANAINIPRYYFIQGISSCNDQGVKTWSDTISSLILTTQTYNSGGSVALDWTDFNPGNIFGNKTTGQYYIWQILNNDTTLADSTVVSYDSLEVTQCYPSSVTYFITVKDTTKYWGCSSISNSSTEIVGDVTPPPTILLDSVSVDLSGQINFGWQSAAVDVKKYYIYRGGVLIDSIPPTQTNYSYTPSASDSCYLAFSVSSNDTCGNSSAPGITQNSICLKILDAIRCDTNEQIIIGWNVYSPSWSNGAVKQEIWRSTNSGPYVLIDSVGPFVNQYSDKTILGSTTYSYRVRSWESGKNLGAWSTEASYSIGPLIVGTIVPAPDLRCVSWLSNTSLKLEWNKPANPDSNLNRYRIYHSTTGVPGSYSAIDSVNGIFTSDNLAYKIIEYTHTGASATTGHYYYLESVSGCDGLQPSTQINKLLRAIDLNVTSISDSVNLLDWNKVSGTMMSPTYNVYRDSGSIGTPAFNNETASDKMVICDKDVMYYVEYPDGLIGCVSTSKSTPGKFKDDTPPAKQFIDSVSMLQDSSFTATIGWSPNTSKGVLNYLVFNCPGGKILDTLPLTARSYTDLANAPINGIVQYSVTAIDSCGNSGLNNQDFDCHNIMDVKLSIDLCNKRIKLSWNAYDDFTSGTNVEYRVFMSVDGSPFSLYTKTLANESNVEDLIEGAYYCFYIQAWENGGIGPFSSSSAVKCKRYNGIRSPDFAYLRYVSVEDSGTVRMCMKIDLNSDLGEYWVKRSASTNTPYQVISTIVVPDPITSADSNFCFEDQPVESGKRSYYYFIEVADPCGNITISSNLGRTMYLEVQTDREKSWNNLTWNRYEEWVGSVEDYLIYRRVDKSSWELIETLDKTAIATMVEVQTKGDKITYRDDVSKEANSGNGEFCYKIVAREGENTFRNSDRETSSSNIVCAGMKPLSYSPNSFTPNGDGLNDKFMPSIAFLDLESFSMEIYNRWGERIYATEDAKNGGWDGKVNGQLATDGAYVYIVRYKSSDGQEYEEQGTVSLMK